MKLFEELEERKTLECGKVRTKRQGLPKETCSVKEKKVKQLKWGESLYRQKRQKGNVTYVTWHDRKSVSVLATTPTTTTDEGFVQLSIKVNDKWKKEDFARPGVVHLYNTRVVSICQTKGLFHMPDS